MPQPLPLPRATNLLNPEAFEKRAEKWGSEGPKKEVNPLTGRVPQSQANAEEVDLAGRVNTILFSRTICDIGLEQAGGHGGQSRPWPLPPLPSPLSPLFAASLIPLTR